jgi:hypothetical protein
MRLNSLAGCAVVAAFLLIPIGLWVGGVAIIAYAAKWVIS